MVWKRSFVVAALVVAAGCGDDRAPSTPAPAPTTTPVALGAEEIAGTYDSSLGIVSVSGTITLEFGLLRESFLELSGPLLPDGSAALSGVRTMTDTGSVAVTGHVLVRRSETEVRIAGDVAGLALDAVRPRAGTPREFSGRYTLAFAQSLSGAAVPTHAEIDVDVPASGRGATLAAADEIDAAGTRHGTLVPGACLVSPRGLLQCRLPYVGVAAPGPFGGPTTFDAVISGSVAPSAGVVRGEGAVIVTNQAPIIAHAFTYTTWAAVRTAVAE